MRTALAAALAALTLTGCSLMIDPDSVDPPAPAAVVVPACLDASGGHSLCNGQVSGGALKSTAGSAYTIKRGTIGAGSAELSGTNHNIQQGVVTP